MSPFADRDRLRRRLLWLLAPVSAIVFAGLVSSIALLLIHESPPSAFRAMINYAKQTDSLISIVNRANPLFLSGLAVAIGFKMGLFNIGVEGQFRIAALLSAAVGGAALLPGPLNVLLIVVVAVAAGAAWAGVAAVLKVTRGVHEVISTIMLNFIATGIGAYLLVNYLDFKSGPNNLLLNTKQIPSSGGFPSLNGPLRAFGVEAHENLYGFVLVAILIGVLYYVLVWRTRFGYDLRATGLNPDAARASGVDPKGMVVRTMLLSGGVAGLVGLPDLLGFFHSYTQDFPVGYGFDGIAVALVGRNNPGGVAFAALLFGFIDRSAQILDFEGIPREVIAIMKGVIILSVVIAYEVVRRIIQAQEVRAAAEKARELSIDLEGAPA